MYDLCSFLFYYRFQWEDLFLLNIRKLLPFYLNTFTDLQITIFVCRVVVEIWGRKPWLPLLGHSYLVLSSAFIIDGCVYRDISGEVV